MGLVHETEDSVIFAFEQRSDAAPNIGKIGDVNRLGADQRILVARIVVQVEHHPSAQLEQLISGIDQTRQIRLHRAAALTLAAGAPRETTTETRSCRSQRNSSVTGSQERTAPRDTHSLCHVSPSAALDDALAAEAGTREVDAGQEWLIRSIGGRARGQRPQHQDTLDRRWPSKLPSGRHTLTKTFERDRESFAELRLTVASSAAASEGGHPKKSPASAQHGPLQPYVNGNADTDAGNHRNAKPHQLPTGSVERNARLDQATRRAPSVNR